MTQQDFFKLWFDNQPLQPRTILNSPAFAMPVKLREQTAFFKWQQNSSEIADEQFQLALLLQDGVEEILLAIDHLKDFPKLEKALLLQNSIPEELLMGIAEAEFSAYAPWLGDNIILKQILPSPTKEMLQDTRPFKITDSENQIVQTGRISRTTGLEERWGIAGNLDIQAYFTETPSYLPAFPCYAGFKLPADDLASLKIGDRLLLPEWHTAEKSADCLIIVDNRIAARGKQENSSLVIQAPWQNFKTEEDELLIRGEEFSLSPLQALQLLEDSSSLKLNLLTLGKFFLYRNGAVIAEGISGEICGRSCMEITSTASL